MPYRKVKKMINIALSWMSEFRSIIKFYSEQLVSLEQQ